MDSETNGPENAVQDGLQNEHSPISRDPERTTDERAEDNASEEAEGVAEGVNEAAGPAEEKNREGDDDRELTTDTSPSD